MYILARANLFTTGSTNVDDRKRYYAFASKLYDFTWLVWRQDSLFDSLVVSESPKTILIKLINDFYAPVFKCSWYQL